MGDDVRSGGYGGVEWEDMMCKVLLQLERDEEVRKEEGGDGNGVEVDFSEVVNLKEVLE